MTTDKKTTDTAAPMKALSVRQPWAWAILFAGKDVENRTWYTGYRGRLLIHAGLYLSGPAAEVRRQCRMLGLSPDAPTRAIVGEVTLVDVRHGSGSRWALSDGEPVTPMAKSGRRMVHWILADPVAYPESIPCKGRLGLWTPPTDVLDEVKRSLEEANA